MTHILAVAAIFGAGMVFGIVVNIITTKHIEWLTGDNNECYCDTCKYWELEWDEMPCDICKDHSEWEERNDVK